MVLECEATPGTWGCEEVEEGKAIRKGKKMKEQSRRKGDSGNEKGIQGISTLSRQDTGR
jgi:hypothetical protein